MNNNLSLEKIREMMDEFNKIRPVSVAVCVPSMTYMMSETAIHLSRMTAYMAAAGIPGEVFGVQCSDICEARNRLLTDCLPYDPSHILWIDADMTFPKETPSRLLAHDKDIVGCFYSSRVAPYRMVGLLFDDSEIDKKGIQKAVYLPGGCVLVKSDVYRKIEAPWYQEQYNVPGASDKNKFGFISDDVFFSTSARDNGYDIWADLDLSEEIGHIGHTTLNLKFKPKQSEVANSDQDK